MSLREIDNFCQLRSVLTYLSDPFRTTLVLTLTTLIQYTGKPMPPNVLKSESTRRPAQTTTSLTKASTNVTTREPPSTSSLCQALPLRLAGPAATRPEIQKLFRRSWTIRRWCVAVSGQRRQCNRSILTSIQMLGSWKITTSNDFLAVPVSIEKWLKRFTKENAIGDLMVQKKMFDCEAQPRKCECVGVSDGVDQGMGIYLELFSWQKPSILRKCRIIPKTSPKVSSRRFVRSNESSAVKHCSVKLLIREG